MSHPEPRPARLLCIDDDPDQHRAVAAMVDAFRRSRYQVDFVQTYDEGLARLVGGQYAACLLDYRLERRDGLDLLREARVANPDTPIIVMTPADADDADIAASEAGAIDSLVKSELTPRVLERAIHYAVKLGATLTQLRSLALTDDLTGLLNRRALHSLLQDEWLRAVRFKRPFSLGLVDIDSFKAVNDAYGHQVGDRVLLHVGRVLGATLRRLDRVARFGGDEIAILMPETGRREAAIAMGRVRAAVGQSPCIIDDPAIQVAITLSIGVAVSLEDADSLDALIAVADKRLYAAKHAGRDRVFLED